MLKRILGAVVICIILSSCGGARKTAGIATKDAEAANVIAQHYETETEFETASGRMRAAYEQENKSQSVTVSFKIEKDEAIWLSAQVLGFPVAKALITPTRVQYYERMGKTYFDGDFSLLSDWLGTPLDFEKLQNLLIGQAIYDLREEEYYLDQSARGLQFRPAGVEEDMEKRFLLDPDNYKAIAQQLSQQSENRSVTVTYNDYQEVSGKLFPQNIKIIANEGGESTNIDLTYRSVTFDEEMNYSFEIPSGYEEISVK